MRLVRVCTSCGKVGKPHDYYETVTIATTCPQCKKKTFVARLP